MICPFYKQGMDPPYIPPENIQHPRDNLPCSTGTKDGSRVEAVRVNLDREGNRSRTTEVEVDLTGDSVHISFPPMPPALGDIMNIIKGIGKVEPDPDG
jgi:hypothetical protein